MLYCLRLTILLLGLSLFGKPLSAQDSLLNFGGQRVHYTILSEATVLNANHQLILKRGVYNYDWDEDYTHESSSAYGYGYGLESFHLEFKSPAPIQVKRVNKKKGFQGREYYLLRVTDADGSLFGWTEIALNQVQEIKGQQDDQKVYAYSINLLGIPMIILQNAQKIEIVKIKEF